MPRTWTQEQRDAAAKRMKLVAEKRWAKTRPPEVQAVIDSMDPARRAKLQGAQNRIWQDNGRADGLQAREALARFEAERGGIIKEVAPTTTNAVDPDAFKAMAMQTSPARDPVRIGSREVSLIVRTDGTMVSQYGPCICGRAKREWHAICCK
jgi:hypothetical protein